MLMYLTAPVLQVSWSCTGVLALVLVVCYIVLYWCCTWKCAETVAGLYWSGTGTLLVRNWSCPGTAHSTILRLSLRWSLHGDRPAPQEQKNRSAPAASDVSEDKCSCARPSSPTAPVPDV